MSTNQKKYTHQIIDQKTGKVIGNYSSLNTARNRADKLDQVYGAIRYIVKPIR